MPNRAAILLSLFLSLSYSSVAQNNSWLQVRTPHFLIVTNSNEKDGRGTAKQFEVMRSVFQRVFADADLDTPEPIPVLAVTDKSTLNDLVPLQYLGQGQLHVAGYFVSYPERTYVLVWTNAPEQHPYAAVYHEYAHFVFSRTQQWMPLWLSEGIASFYQNTEILNDKVQLGKADAYMQHVLEKNALLPLPTLFAIDTHSPYYQKEDQGTVFYAESWALIHYLKDNDALENTNHINDYLQMVQTEDPVAAAREAFGDLDQLLTELRKYIASPSYAISEISGSTDVDESSFEVRPISMADTNNLRAEFLSYVGRYSDARVLLQRILREDPQNAAAYTTSCHIDVLEREFDEARKLCQQAIKFDPNDFLAHYWFGVASLKQTTLAKAELETVAENLRSVIKIKPMFAPAYDALALFYVSRGTHLTDAQELVTHAVELLPGAPEVRADQAQVLFSLNKRKEALDTLQVALKYAHTPEQAAAVETVMKAMQDAEAVEEKSRSQPVRLVGQDGVRGTSPAADSSETPPRAIYSPDVEYTDQARDAKLEGVCVVRLMIGVDGKPTSVAVMKKIGMGMDEKVVETLKTWRFEPARRNGKPVPARLDMSMQFKTFGQSAEKVLELSARARQGDPEAELELANAFFAGRDVTRDDAQGLVLLERAASSGLTAAQLEMGERIYGDGSNADNYVMAYVWYSLAQRNGTEQAATKVAELEARMTPAQLSEARKRAASWPDPPSH
jgi:TonB family protein